MTPGRRGARLSVDGALVADVDVLQGFWARQLGLLGTRPGPRAVWLERCRSVHSWGMRYALDVALVDSAGVVRSVRRLRPWRGPIHSQRGVTCVLEAREGLLEEWGVAPGSVVRWEG